MSLPFDSSKLRYFVPLCEISPSNFDELVKNVQAETLPANKAIFNRGEKDDFTYYLLSGELELTDADGTSILLSSKSKQCRFPLEHNNPRNKSAITKTDVHYIKINNDLLDVLLTWDQNKNYIVNEISDDESSNTDWMTQLLQTEIFHKIPPANIQAFFQRIEPIPVQKDEVIIKQGDQGDYYYFIKSGNCRVLLNSKETGNKEIKIADINAGNSFGEEALISNEPRNATVIMNTDGSLMRLAKEDFNELLKVPVLNTIDYGSADKLVKENKAYWLDVRLSSEYTNNNIKGSINIPLFLLRLNANKLSKEHKYIVCCDTGSRSESAAYILKERGYDSYVLDGGINGVPQNEGAA